jgi:hypothetical protein
VDDNLQGTLPSELALLTKLTSFRIENTKVTGQIPNLASLEALTSLKIRNNPNLEAGTIPDMFDAMASLRSM